MRVANPAAVSRSLAPTITDRERERIESLSHKFGSVAVLDESRRYGGFFAIAGIYALHRKEAFDEDGDMVRNLAPCDAYVIAFVVERGEWHDPGSWFGDMPVPLAHLLDPDKVTPFEDLIV